MQKEKDKGGYDDGSRNNHGCKRREDANEHRDDHHDDELDREKSEEKNRKRKEKTEEEKEESLNWREYRVWQRNSETEKHERQVSEEDPCSTET